jgi:hypothetical protein
MTVSYYYHFTLFWEDDMEHEFMSGSLLLGINLSFPEDSIPSLAPIIITPVTMVGI